MLLGAFGDPGHAFPVLALGRALVARGHEVLFETWSRWADEVRAAGMEFVAAPEYPTFPRPGQPLKPYEAAIRSVAETRPVAAEFGPDVLVHDILTIAPALVAELEGVPRATMIPHVHPSPPRGAPPYAIGARRAQTALGRRFWGALEEPLGAGLRRGRDELNETRRRLGLAPEERLFAGISDRLVLVGTFPQLEYPRRWAAHEHVVGPLMWEPSWPVDPELPPGDAPLVVVAPSTAQDPSHGLLRATLTGLARADVRVLATWNRRPPPVPFRVPANARVVEWLSYSRAFAAADLVVCHGGHGTMVRALASGCPVLVVPAGGDQAENAARADWAGVGVRLPWQLLTPGTVRLAVERALRDGGRRATRARELADWAAAHDGAARGAELVEELAAPGRRRERAPADVELHGSSARSPSSPVRFARAKRPGSEC